MHGTFASLHAGALALAGGTAALGGWIVAAVYNAVIGRLPESGTTSTTTAPSRR
jgi:hypothetical protein